MKRFFWCDIHYACVGIEATDGIVTLAAPIVKWMLGKTLAEVKTWLVSKKAIVKEI